MYIELLVTAVATQRDLAAAYTASQRLKEIGLYYAAMTDVSLRFFRLLEPGPTFVELHHSFLTWLESGGQALREEIQLGHPIDSPATKEFLSASQRFSECMDTVLQKNESLLVDRAPGPRK